MHLCKQVMVTLRSARTARDIAVTLLPHGKRTRELENAMARYGKDQPDPDTELIGNKAFFK